MERRLDSCIKYTIVAGKKVLAMLPQIFTTHCAVTVHLVTFGLPQQKSEPLCSREGCL